MNRSQPLRSDPAKTRAWQERSRRKARFQNRTRLRSSRMIAESAAKREDEQRRRSAYSVVARRAAGVCEARTDVCTGRHEHTHHRAPRSASSVRNENRHDPELLLAVCHACHDRIHSHPEESYRRGWLIRRGNL